MPEKRGYSTAEAMAYLGVRRRTFDTVIKPLLDGRGVRAGTSIIYERQDLDDAWERYKLLQGSERVQPKGDMKWQHVHEGKVASPRTRSLADGRSTPSTEGSAFANVVSRITGRQRTS